jgi:NIMA (never in mitosis gene a)-related kinase
LDGGVFGFTFAGSQTSFAQSAVGTPYYLSPELCNGQPYNHKSDIWALGCVLYELATFKHAFDATNLPALVMTIVNGQYKPVSQQYSVELQVSAVIAIVNGQYRRGRSSTPSSFR